MEEGASRQPGGVGRQRLFGLSMALILLSVALFVLSFFPFYADLFDSLVLFLFQVRLLVLALLVGLGCFVYDLVKKEIGRSCLLQLAFVFIVAMPLVAQCNAEHFWDLRYAGYRDRVVLAIEAYRDEKGSYPEELEEVVLPSPRRVAARFEPSFHYRRGEGTFELQVQAPGPGTVLFPGTWIYCPEEKEWRFFSD